MNITALIAAVMAMVTSFTGGIIPATSSLPIPPIVHDWDDDRWDDDDWDDDDWDD